MNLTRQMWFWLVALVVVAVLIWLLRGVLLPFVAGMAIAYLLDPVAKRLERIGLNRMLATLLILAAFVVGAVVVGILIAPIIGGQLAALIAKVPDYVTKLQQVITDPNREWLRKIVGDAFDPSDSVSELVKQGMGWVTAFLRSLWSGGEALISIFSLMVVTPVVAFYLISDWERLVTTVDSWVPRPHLATVRMLGRQIDQAIAGFVRGQVALCLILGSYYALALTVAGLNFGFLIGFIAGLISFIPYVGSLTGLVLGTGVAVAQFWPHYAPVITVVVIFMVGQFLEGYVLAPKLVGERVGLHPVWLMFALFAFGYLFGFVGLLLAVPLAAAVGVLARFALHQYRASPLYTGEGGEAGKGETLPAGRGSAVP